MSQNELQEAAAMRAWDGWWALRANGTLITPLPITDVQALAARMFTAGVEFGRLSAEEGAAV